jgi:polyisoprenoid-binding protein YceI
MTKLILFFLVVAYPTSLMADDAASYYIPPAQFSASLQVMSLGFANVVALFQNATGSFSFDDGDKSITHLRLAIGTDSLVTSSTDNQRDLKVLLNVAQYPEIQLTAPERTLFKDGKATISVQLTLHGTTKPVTFDATLNHVGDTPYGGGLFAGKGQAVGVSLHGTLKRADFGMGEDPDSGDKNRFGDVIMLQLEMQAIKQ